MPRPRKPIPSYLPHKQSGRARAVWTDPTGTRRFRLLAGAFDSPESRDAFAALLLQLDAAPHHPPAADPGGLTLAELLLAYLGHAERHYRTPDGKPTSEVYEVKLVVRACDKAFPPPGELAQRAGETHARWWGQLTPSQRAEVAAWRKAHRWHPNQLRHSFATRVRKQHGLEAAQVLLGHARADVTQVYAERNEELASAVAAKIG